MGRVLVKRLVSVFLGERLVLRMDFSFFFLFEEENNVRGEREGDGRGGKWQRLVSVKRPVYAVEGDPRRLEFGGCIRRTDCIRRIICIGGCGLYGGWICGWRLGG